MIDSTRLGIVIIGIITQDDVTTDIDRMCLFSRFVHLLPSRPHVNRMVIIFP